MASFDWLRLLLVCALFVAGRGVLLWRGRRAIARAAGEPDSHAALEGLARDLGTVLGTLCVLLFLLERGAFRDALTATAQWLVVLLLFWWLYAGFARQHSALLVAHRGEAWRAPIHRALGALTLGPVLGVPIVAAGLAVLALATARGLGVPAEAISPYLALAPILALPVWGLWASRLVRRHFRDPEPLPGAVAAQVAERLGQSAAARMGVLRTRGQAFYNAVALVDRRPTQIWISDELLDALATDEATAILLHEWSHRDRRDDLRRVGWSLAIHGALLLGLVALDRPAGLVLSSALFAAAFFVASTSIGQRHEQIADANAADHELADAMGRALVKLHTLNALPSSAKGEAFLTHPLLARRLAALGFEPEAPVADTVPD